MNEQGTDMMDWTPTNPSPSSSRVKSAKNNDDDGSWLRRQKFFPPEQPTGLEGLFAKTLRVDEDKGSTTQQGRVINPRSTWKWLWVGALLLAPLLAVQHRFWWQGYATVTQKNSIEREEII
jgi:hypothetical protein